MEYVQRKSLRQLFWRINVSEVDLLRLAELIRQRSGGEKFEVEVRSADQQDMFRAKEPQFFTSEIMPQAISLVRISGVRSTPSLACEIELRAGKDRLAELTVSGHDITTVSGLFHELARELQAKQVAGSWLAQHVDSFFVYFLVSLLAALAVYSAFDMPLDLASKYVPNFYGSALHKSIQYLGWVTIVLSMTIGGRALYERLEALFPAVEFSGRLVDPSTRKRRTLAAVMALIFIPITLNVLANFATDVFKLWIFR